MKNQKVRVWDGPLRVFHWSLVILIAVSIYTGEVGGFQEMDYHMQSGYVLLGLILFRIVWGFLGSYHARFVNFTRVRALPDYVRGLFNRGKTSVGHNPLGALNVYALLIVVLIQAITGLFADDDIFTSGPLVHLISSDTGDLITSIHHINAKVLYVLIALHLVAILFYEFFHRDRLILPMITGKKALPEDAAQQVEPPRVWRELITAVVIGGIAAGGVYYLINYV